MDLEEVGALLEGGRGGEDGGDESEEGELGDLHLGRWFSFEGEREFKITKKEWYVQVRGITG